MIRIDTLAIICALQSHGEHGAVVRLLTPEYGLLAGYAPGARGRDKRAILIRGNRLSAVLQARSATQLPSLSCELVASIGPLLSEPLPALALEWVTILTATVLPEGHPYPRLYAALEGLLGAMLAAQGARDWMSALPRYEELLLAELGYGRPSAQTAVNEGIDVIAELGRTGRQVEEHLLVDRRARIGGTRDRLLDRLTKATG